MKQKKRNEDKPLEKLRMNKNLRVIVDKEFNTLRVKINADFEEFETKIKQKTREV